MGCGFIIISMKHLGRELAPQVNYPGRRRQRSRSQSSSEDEDGSLVSQAPIRSNLSWSRDVYRRDLPRRPPWLCSPPTRPISAMCLRLRLTVKPPFRAISRCCSALMAANPRRLFLPRLVRESWDAVRRAWLPRSMARRAREPPRWPERPELCSLPSQSSSMVRRLLDVRPRRVVWRSGSFASIPISPPAHGVFPAPMAVLPGSEMVRRLWESWLLYEPAPSLVYE